MLKLKDRQLNVLGLVVQLFTTTGQPVGSATLKKLGVNASSATIRNDLALLEELGFLEKTHVSSGRIPSNQGYRYYVDHLLHPTLLDTNAELKIQKSFGDRFIEMDDLLQKSASILSNLTNMTAFVLGPNHNERVLSEFHLLPISKTKGMAIIVTSGGNVESQIFPIPEQLTDNDFERMQELVKERFVGESFTRIYQRLKTELPITLQKYVTNPQLVIDLFELILDHVFEDKVYVSGQMNLLDAVDSGDIEQFRKLFMLLNDNHELMSIVPKSDQEIDIKIGDEISNELLSDMTLITAKYQVFDNSGILALIGPRKMAYDKTIGIIQSFQSEMQNQVINYLSKLGNSKL